MTLLPEEFADLEPFAAEWALESEPERWAKRHASSIEEMRALYDAVFPRVEAVCAHLDGFTLGELPEQQRNLLHLVQSFVLVTFPVEVWGGPRIPDTGHAQLVRASSPRY
jgi:hypothetical protein